MKKIFAVLTVGVMLASMGCSTLGLGQPLKVPEDADKDKMEPKPKRLPPARTDIDAAEITDVNYPQQANNLESELKRESKFISPAK
ncbi:hypothetical protein [Zavarzinella formosa]|uniref:hypothetical protein n=1 Tax=Zavarzinella formosa TaxID=360055 RepID=UPI0002DE5307|nr:hypothetical protein [Zavarzinella formosa]